MIDLNANNRHLFMQEAICDGESPTSYKTYLLRGIYMSHLSDSNWVVAPF